MQNRQIDVYIYCVAVANMCAYSAFVMLINFNLRKKNINFILHFATSIYVYTKTNLKSDTT